MQALYKVRKKIPKGNLRTLYFAFAYPIICYAVEIYANANKTALDQLVKSNNRILRILQFKPLRSTTTELYKCYNTLPVYLLHEYKLCIFIFKYFYFPSLLPPALKGYLKQNKDINTYTTRQNLNLFVERCNSSLGKRKLNFHAAVIWNGLPKNLRTSQTLNNFKKCCIEYKLTQL